MTLLFQSQKKERKNSLRMFSCGSEQNGALKLVTTQDHHVKAILCDALKMQPFLFQSMILLLCEKKKTLIQLLIFWPQLWDKQFSLSWKRRRAAKLQTTYTYGRSEDHKSQRKAQGKQKAAAVNRNWWLSKNRKSWKEILKPHIPVKTQYFIPSSFSFQTVYYTCIPRFESPH